MHYALYQPSIFCFIFYYMYVCLQTIDFASVKVVIKESYYDYLLLLWKENVNRTTMNNGATVCIYTMSQFNNAHVGDAECTANPLLLLSQLKNRRLRLHANKVATSHRSQLFLCDAHVNSRILRELTDYVQFFNWSDFTADDILV